MLRITRDGAKIIDKKMKFKEDYYQEENKRN